jgi:hypothetical protein
MNRRNFFKGVMAVMASATVIPSLESIASPLIYEDEVKLFFSFRTPVFIHLGDTINILFPDTNEEVSFMPIKPGLVTGVFKYADRYVLAFNRLTEDDLTPSK